MNITSTIVIPRCDVIVVGSLSNAPVLDRLAASQIAQDLHADQRGASVKACYDLYEAFDTNEFKAKDFVRYIVSCAAQARMIVTMNGSLEDSYTNQLIRVCRQLEIPIEPVDKVLHCIREHKQWLPNDDRA